MTDGTSIGGRYYERMEAFMRSMCPQADPDKPMMPIVMALTPWIPDIRKTVAGEDDPAPAHYHDPIWSQAQSHRDAFVHCIQSSDAFPKGSPLWVELRQQAHVERLAFQALGHDICAPVDWELDRYWPEKAPG